MIYRPPGPYDQPAGHRTPAADGGHGWLGWLATRLDTVPGWAWAAALTAIAAATLITIPVARRLAYRAGQRAAGHSTGDRRDRTLLVAALTPAALFWLAVLIGSARGLVAFGRDTLRWSGGWEYLVPVTLDGIAVAFGALAFRALHNRRNPDRAMRIAWAAMAASAAINFFHEAGLAVGSPLGGGYLALMSLFGMLIFHELLSQFEDGTEWIRRTNPKFGLRWLTWPTNTACAWVAWRNYPPAADTHATVAAAVAHLDAVRAGKRARRAAAHLSGTVRPWWAPLAPWVYAARLDAALAEQRSTAEAERAERDEIGARLAGIEAAHAEALRNAERAIAEAEQRHRAALAEQAARLQAQHAEQLAAVRAELAGNLLRFDRGAPTRTGRSSGGERRPGPARGSDTDALRVMFAEHPERDFAWTDREVNRITGAGFSSRAPRLAALAAEHIAGCPAERHDTCLTDRKENAS